METSTIALIIIVGLLLVLCFYFRRRNVKLREELEDVHFKKKSQSSRYGKMTEQFLPFLHEYPYDPQNFRFLGTPIDGVQFNEDGIVLVEFKTADSRLTQKQREIRDLVEDGRVEFKEFRI